MNYEYKPYTATLNGRLVGMYRTVRQAKAAILYTPRREGEGCEWRIHFEDRKGGIHLIEEGGASCLKS